MGSLVVFMGLVRHFLAVFEWFYESLCSWFQGWVFRQLHRYLFRWFCEDFASGFVDNFENGFIGDVLAIFAQFRSGFMGVLPMILWDFCKYFYS